VSGPKNRANGDDGELRRSEPGKRSHCHRQTGARARPRPPQVCGRRAVPRLSPPAIPTTSSLPSSARWAAKSATASLSRSAGCTTGSCTAAAMRVPGGRPKGIDPLVVAAMLWAKTHQASIPGDHPITLNRNFNGYVGHGAGAADWPQNDETKPIVRPEAE
jgi:hypothetical protein